MVYKKINTGVYNLLLIRVRTNEVFEVDIDKRKKKLKIIYDKSEDEYLDFKDLLDENSRSPKVIGLQYIMKEKDFRALLPAEQIFLIKQYFTKKFDHLLVQEDWGYNELSTLIIRS